MRSAADVLRFLLAFDGTEDEECDDEDEDVREEPFRGKRENRPERRVLDAGAGGTEDECEEEYDRLNSTEEAGPVSSS